MAHASGGLATYCCPCGPHRRATVAGLGLVGGTVRSSQDADLLHIASATYVRSLQASRPASVEPAEEPLCRPPCAEPRENGDREFGTQDLALKAARELKGRFPMLQVKVYDAESKQSETIELAAA